MACIYCKAQKQKKLHGVHAHAETVWLAMVACFHAGAVMKWMRVCTMHATAHIHEEPTDAGVFNSSRCITPSFRLI